MTDFGSEIIPYTLCGVTFNATREAIGAFTCFDRNRPEATDLGPNGMVAEAEAFVRIVHERNLRCLVDVGALFGVYSLLFTAGRRHAVAFALEASDSAYSILADQVNANPDSKICALTVFAGDTQGRKVDCIRDWKHVIANMTETERNGRERYSVTECTIDNLPLPEVDCMKIDVEAYECQVLRGARSLIETCRPIIFLEVHTNNLPDNGETPESLMALLSDMGYVPKHYDGTEVHSFRDYSMTRVVCWPEVL